MSFFLNVKCFRYISYGWMINVKELNCVFKVIFEKLNTHHFYTVFKIAVCLIESSDYS